MAGSAFGIKDSANVYLKNLATKSIIYIPYFNKFGIDLKGDSVYALKKGQKSIKWNKALEGTFTGDLEILNSQIMALMLGCELVKADSTNIFKKEDITVSTGDTATLSEAPVTDSLTVMIPDSDGVVATTTFEVITTGTVATGQVKLSGTTLTFFTGEAPVGTKLFITYLVASANKNKFTVYGNGDTANYALYANVEVKMEGTGETEYRQICIPKASVKREMKLDFDSENPSKFSLSGDMLADANDEILTFTEL